MSGPSAVDFARLSPLAWGRLSLRQLERPRHLAAIERALLRVATGETKRLVVLAPPRHGKSVTSAVLFTSWFLGTYPDRRVAVVSHTEELAASFGRRARDMLGEHGAKTFGVRVRDDVKAAGRWDLASPHVGGFLAAGVGGGLTGKGFDLVVLDDVVKSNVEAYSEATRKSTRQWYATTLRTRLQPGGAIVVLQTLWHEDDLASSLIRASEDGTGEKFEVLRLPAIAEEDDAIGRAPGEALWPEVMPLEALLQARKACLVDGGERAWSALWQQRATPSEGAVFKSSWWEGRRYTWTSPTHVQVGSEPPVAVGALRITAALDVALSTKTSADYTACVVIGRATDGRVFVLDVLRKKLEAPELVREVRAFALVRWRAPAIHIERAGVGLAIVQQARAAGLPVLEVAVDRDKVSRALPLAAAFEGGKLVLPERAPWLAELERELLEFPGGRHDDQVDALAHAWAAEAIPKYPGIFCSDGSDPDPGGWSGDLGGTRHLDGLERPIRLW